MTLLATFKHISSKNADYGAAEQYLTFEHDEFTMKPTLDENGRLMLREDYAQQLYEKKLLTYPRTDSQYLTDDMLPTAESLVSGLWPKHLPPVFWHEKRGSTFQSSPRGKFLLSPP